MVTGTAAPAIKTARDFISAGAPAMAREEIDYHAPRFFVQMGWTVLNVDTAGIPNRYLLRGEITPCISTRKKANIAEIPEGMLIQGSEESDRDGRIVWGYYPLPAWYEAQRLMENEAAAELRNGLFEIKSVNPNFYRQNDLNQIFYPQGLHMLPERNSELIAHLEERILDVEANKAGRDAQTISILVQIGRELIRAALEADRIQVARLTYVHTCMRLQPKEENYKRDYDAVDEEMLVRTGTPRLHDAERKTADALSLLAEGKVRGDADEVSALKLMVKSQEDQMAMLREQMAMMREQMAQNAEIQRQQMEMQREQMELERQRLGIQKLADAPKGQRPNQQNRT